MRFSIIIFSIFFFLLPFAFSNAEQVIYNNPVWGDIDQENPPQEPVTHPANTDIGFNGGESLLTAFHFCDALGYGYVSHLHDGTANPTVIYLNNLWSDAQNKEDFLQIVCDDGVVSTSTVPDIIVDVDVPDYTSFLQFFIVLFSSIFFLVIVLYFSYLVKKFL